MPCEKDMKKTIPTYTGMLRDHSISVPQCIYECSGISIFGRRIKSLVFSTDAAIIKNINTDAVLAVYPFTPQPVISQSIITVSDVPVFVGVGGGVTTGARSVRLAIESEHQGAYGVVVNAPIACDVITAIDERIAAGADILNVSAAAKTPELVRFIRERYPDIGIIATGGPTDDTIRQTIQAGANAITYTPPTNGELFAASMRRYRDKFTEG